MENFDTDTEWSKLKELVTTLLEIPESRITPQASFTKDLGADSLDVVELLMEVEKQFDITFPDEAAERIHTPGDLLDFIHMQQKTT